MLHRLLFLAAAPLLLAQDSRTLIENDQIRVVKVTVPVNRKLSLQQHMSDRVMIYFGANGDAEVRWIPATRMDTAEIKTAKPSAIVEVDLIKTANVPAKVTGARDPVQVDPKHYRVEFENQRVRVLRVVIGPHESAPMHEHVLDRLVTYIQDQNMRVTTPDGKSDIVQHKAGEVAWVTGTSQHKEENLGPEPFQVVVVELKK